MFHNKTYQISMILFDVFFIVINLIVGYKIFKVIGK